MPAYVVLDISVSDPDLFEEYKQLAPETIVAYGGKYLTRVRGSVARFFDFGFTAQCRYSH